MQASIVFLYRGLKHNACFIFQTPLFVFLCFIANKPGRSNKHLNGFILVLFVCLKKKTTSPATGNCQTRENKCLKQKKKIAKKLLKTNKQTNNKLWLVKQAHFCPRFVPKKKG